MSQLVLQQLIFSTRCCMVQNKQIFIALVVFAGLAGCSSAPKIEYKTVEVKVPFRTPCSAKTPIAPEWLTPLVLKGADVYVQMRALLADRELSKGYQNELETALSTCKR